MTDALVSHLPHVQFHTEVPLCAHTSFGIGGPATYFTEVHDTNVFAEIIRAARQLRIDTLVLGGGTNLLVSDEGFNGLAIQLNMREIEFDPNHLTLRIGAGVPTSTLVDWLVDNGLGGLEFAAGLPGTIGGAIAGNAGCFGHTLSDFLVSATIVNRDGETQQIDDVNWFEFGYRHSKLAKTDAVLTRAVFRIERGDRKKLRDQAGEYLNVRANKHPKKGIRTAGSYFKNLTPLEPGGRRRAAGALLDQAGAHGLHVGDAAVFEQHANIVINRGNASARDVLQLTHQMAALVKSRFGVILEPEVRFVGPRPDGL